MSDWPIVGVAGARGVVGGVFLSILADAGLPAACLRAFGTDAGSVAYGSAQLPVSVLDDEAARELEVLFLATDGEISRSIITGPGRLVPLIVDNSSAFRLDPDVPLVVPEANASVLAGYRGNLVANPNCTTAAAVVALAPIRDAAGLESVDLASYQAVSGAGRAGLEAFELERREGGTHRAEGSPFHGRIADSVVPEIDVLADDGWSGEERKIIAELRKILDLPELDVAATTVRVPVHTGHSVALHFRTRQPATVEQLEAVLRAAPGLEYRPADGSDRHPMPLDVVGRDPVLVGRLRAIPGRERGFALFLSSDNLRKGAALNAIQAAASSNPDRFSRLVPQAR
ncbi:MAG TPA: aspartate-semialdehyde dehydrogenase [Candidatus Limnocylindrales bacterium]|nr:aspartate-semialdehyde dehydrogenase [Candidatus Limnocylindrales bacterium]